MTDLRQAAMQALEALEDERYVTKYTHIVEAITALRKALEQPEPTYKVTVVDNQHPNGIPYKQWATPPEAQPEQQAEPVAVYGYCPVCGAKGAMRERRPNGNDKCTNGHTYPSSTALKQQAEPVAKLFGTLPVYDTTPPAAQRPWVGLTDEEIENLRKSFATRPAIAAIEAKLKERNT